MNMWNAVDSELKYMCKKCAGRNVREYAEKPFTHFAVCLWESVGDKRLYYLASKEDIVFDDWDWEKKPVSTA
jgi:hypothetical protein